jgi:hypothetical protein
VLALDLVEHRSGAGIVALVEPLPRQVVEGVDVARDILSVGLGLLAAGGAGAERKDEAAARRAGLRSMGGFLAKGWDEAKRGLGATVTRRPPMNAGLMSGL